MRIIRPERRDKRLQRCARVARVNPSSSYWSWIWLRALEELSVDFIRGMIPHHQGAIDMAKVVLQYGKDPQTRKWAEDIIREQAREIAEMHVWFAKNKIKGQ